MAPSAHGIYSRRPAGLSLRWCVAGWCAAGVLAGPPLGGVPAALAAPASPSEDRPPTDPSEPAAAENPVGIEPVEASTPELPAPEPPPAEPRPQPSAPSATPATPATVPPAPPDRPRRDIVEESWLKRYRPRRAAELGVAVGALLPSRDHELYDYTTTWAPYRPAAASLAVRAGYYPLSFLGVEAEGGVAPARTDAGRATLFGARGHVVAQLPLYSVAPFALVGGGVLGTTGVLGRDVDLALHFGGGLKILVNRWVGVRLDARAYLGAAHTAAAYRTFSPEVTASLVITLGRPYLDTDRDGVPDPGQRARVEDACPREAGVKSLRGCPDADSDAIRDGDDRCPAQAGLAARDGCPALVDTDGDGYYDAGQYQIPDGLEDKCDSAAGVKEYTGCPIPDSDGDGHDDLHDDCPRKPETANGFDDSDGCPDKIPPDVKRLLGAIKGIQFGFLSAQLTEPSKVILKRAAGILDDYPDLRLEIQGHTDGDGDPAANKALSLRRAESVRRELIAGGIAEERLRAVGYGSEQPIDTSDSDASRSINRRIEFRLLDTEGHPLEVVDEPSGKP